MPVEGPAYGTLGLWLYELTLAALLVACSDDIERDCHPVWLTRSPKSHGDRSVRCRNPNRALRIFPIDRALGVRTLVQRHQLSSARAALFNSAILSRKKMMAKTRA